MPRPRRCVAVALAGALLVAMCGCAGENPGAGTGTTGRGLGADDVSVSVYQPRPDVAAGRIAIQVHNDSAEQLTVESAELTSAYFQDELVWPALREARISAGRAVDLRVQLGESDCDEPNVAEHSVSLRYRLGDGPSQTAMFEPTDEFGVLELLHDAACLGVRIGEVATLTAESVVVPDQPGVPTTLKIGVEPTGASGSFTVDAVTSTTLLAPAENGVGVGQLALGISVGADGPTEITIPLVPNRCDPHALAEDKVGTRMPLLVTAPDGSAGRLVLAADDGLRAQMYAFFSAYCGLD